MPRGKLNECYVQNRVIEFLRDYYSEKFNSENVFAEKELCVKNSFKRVDGLIAVKHGEKDFFIAVVEAKSYRTIKSLIPVDDDERWFLHGIFTGIILSLITGFLVPFVLWLRIIIIIVAMLGGTFLYWLATSRFISYRFIGVVKQIKNYPAHERWIAFSADALNCLNKRQINDFEEMLKMHGIGLIIISPKNKVTIRFEPKTVDNKNKLQNIIDMYIRSNEIQYKLTNH